MTEQFKHAYSALYRMGCPVKKKDDHFVIRSEPDSKWADCESLDVNPKIEKLLLKHGLYYDWNNDGNLEVYSD